MAHLLSTHMRFTHCILMSRMSVLDVIHLTVDDLIWWLMVTHGERQNARWLSQLMPAHWWFIALIALIALIPHIGIIYFYSYSYTQILIFYILTFLTEIERWWSDDRWWSVDESMSRWVKMIRWSSLMLMIFWSWLLMLMLITHHSCSSVDWLLKHGKRWRSDGLIWISGLMVLGGLIELIELIDTHVHVLMFTHVHWCSCIAHVTHHKLINS